MKLTRKLLSYLNRVFDKDPGAFVAFRLSYPDGRLRWRVEEGRLTTAVTGGPGEPLDVDLAAHSLDSLAAFIAGRPGYGATRPPAEAAGLSARVLLDGAGDLSVSGGDALKGYTSLLWAWLEAVAGELAHARRQADQAVLQMNIRTAGDVWLDELGGYYGVTRRSGESDALYGPRIIASVLRPKANNIAIASAVEAYVGQPTTVTDVVIRRGAFPLYSGAIQHDGAYTHANVGVIEYGLFDVATGFDILHATADVNAYRAAVAALVNELRAAGTHMRALSLTGSRLQDSSPSGVEGDLSFSAGLTVSNPVSRPRDALALDTRARIRATDASPGGAHGRMEIALAQTTTYDGLRRHDGRVRHGSGGPDQAELV
mgnify:CR=1 FL=1